MNIIDLMPTDTPAYMTEAWLSCLSWSAGESELVAGFMEDTGAEWSPTRGTLESMIDNATGVDEAIIPSFVHWFNANVWGRVDEKEEG